MDVRKLPAQSECQSTDGFGQYKLIDNASCRVLDNESSIKVRIHRDN